LCKLDIRSHILQCFAQGKIKERPIFSGNINLCPARAISLSRQYGTVLVQHENSCYELLNSKVAWNHAEYLCQQAGGHLVHINSATEQQYIEAFMSRYNPNHAVWLGLHDRRTEGHFEWTAGYICFV